MPNAPKRKRILVVDDHPILRQGLCQLLQAEPDLEVCGEAQDAAQGLALAQKLSPDLVLADITLPGRSGIDLIKDLRAVLPDVPVLVLSMHDESIYAERVLQAGGRGYLMKDEGGRKLIEAIRHVLAGNIHISSQLSARIIERFSGRREISPSSPVQGLTEREFEVFQGIGAGKTTREIAAALHLSIKTVEVHRLNIKRKLKVRTAPELVRFAVRWMESDGAGGRR